MFSTVFSVAPQHLAQLDAEGGVELTANLLWAEARRLGFSTTKVEISRRVDVADGGVDAAVDPSGIDDLGDSFLFAGRSTFQIKTGSTFIPSRQSHIKRALFGSLKPGRDALGGTLKAALDNQAAYFLVCSGTDPTKGETTKAKKFLKDFFKVCGYSGVHVEVWGQSKIIGIMHRFPSLSLKLNGKGDVYLQPRSLWLTQTEMRRIFKAGPKQEIFLESVRKELRRNDGPVHIRVRGEAGIGKTRLVLEATSPDDLDPLLLYFPSPRVLLEGGLTAHLINDQPKPTAILVVDECDAQNRAEIWNQIQAHSPRLKLISMYNDVQELSGTTVLLEVPALDATNIAEILRGYDVPGDEAMRWASFCDGSPRVAHVLGQNLRDNPQDILRSPDTVNVWDRYIAGGDVLDSESVRERKTVLTHVALFKRFGYGNPVHAEARAIAKLVQSESPQITWPKFQQIVRLLRERKILQGETTLYITPRLLHIRLWKDWWDTYGESFELTEFTKTLPGQLVGWFQEMFEYGAQSEAALKVATKILGPKGSFRGPSFLADRRAASFFLSLTSAAPEAALQCLERIFRRWKADQFAKLEDGRREVVWALERIAVWRSLFTGAARMLLRLAEAENESISNNATGVFADLFSHAYGKLAPTEASPAERFPVLKEALESRSKKQRQVAIRACGDALGARAFSKIIGAEYQGLKHPPELWTPKLWVELFDSYRMYWGLVRSTVDRSPKDEIESLIKTLIQASRGLARIHDLTSTVRETFADLAEKHPEYRRRFVAAVEDIVRYEKSNIAPNELEAWELLRSKLIGDSFHSLMDRYVAMDLLHDEFDVQGNPRDAAGPKIRMLAEKAVENPLLLAGELSWLVTAEAKNGYRFGSILAELDDKFTLITELISAQRSCGASGNVFFLAGYFAVLFSRNPRLWETTILDLANDKRVRQFVPELVWRSGMTDRSAEVVLSLAKQAVVPAELLRMFSYGGVVRKIRESIFHKWIYLLLGRRTRISASVALDLWTFYYLMADEKPTIPPGLTLKILTCDAFFKKNDGPEGVQLEEFHWTRLATVLLNQHPKLGHELAGPLINSFGTDGTIMGGFEPEARRILERLAGTSPREIWDLISNHLISPDSVRAFRLSRWLRSGALNLIPPDLVWKWIKADVGKRAAYAASFVPGVWRTAVGGICWPRELLVRYGRRKDVQRALYGNFQTEFWHGLTSSHYEEKKNGLQNLRVGESNVNVLNWIDKFIDSLNETVAHARVQEERE
jgi:hypothetical protein